SIPGRSAVATRPGPAARGPGRRRTYTADYSPPKTATLDCLARKLLADPLFLVLGRELVRPGSRFRATPESKCPARAGQGRLTAVAHLSRAIFFLPQRPSLRRQVSVKSDRGR